MAKERGDEEAEKAKEKEEKTVRDSLRLVENLFGIRNVSILNET